MSPSPTRGGDATSDNVNIIGLNDRYVASLTTTPGIPDDPTRICSYCSFLIHLGRGPVVKETCKLCLEECFPEVASA